MYNGYFYFFSSDEELVPRKCFIMVIYYKMPAKFKKEREETEKSLYFKDFYWYKKIARAIFHSILNFKEKDN